MPVNLLCKMREEGIVELSNTLEISLELLMLQGKPQRLTLLQCFMTQDCLKSFCIYCSFLVILDSFLPNDL